MRIIVIGGDLRQIYTAYYLAEQNHDVVLIGFNKKLSSISVNVPNTHKSDITYLNALKKISKVKVESDISSLKNADAVVFGVVSSKDNINVYSPFSDDLIPLSDIYSSVPDNTVICHGKGLNKIENDKNLKFVNYLDREEFAVLNAISTAEGAIQYAMAYTDYTIHNSKTLVLGYGRIGKILSRYLRMLGSNTTATARNEGDVSQIFADGIKPLYTEEAVEQLNKYDIIFNTIPKQLILYPQLKKITKDCVIIDLASAPGGVDFDAALSLNVNAVWAQGLPGKVACKTSGEIVSKTILNILKEHYK